MSPFALTEANHDTLGGRISMARKAMAYSTSSLAKQLGVTEKTISGWEADRAAPRANKLVMLAGLLSVSPSWLLDGAGESPDTGRGEDPVSPAVTRAQILELRRQSVRMTEQLDAILASLD